MLRKTSRRRKVAALVGVATAILFSTGGTASAYVDHWFAGTLSGTSGYMSTAAHSISYIEGDVVGGNGTQWCVGRGLGAAGPVFVNSDYLCDARPASSLSTRAAASIPPYCCAHAGALNYGTFTNTFTSATHYDF